MAEPLERPSQLAAGGTKNTTRASPISILDKDTLLCIFEMITLRRMRWFHFGGRGRPLQDVRAGSQVCQAWRSILLNSPSIWGRCIDLNQLMVGKSEWWEVVLRRTWTSPLWVVGVVPYSKSTPSSGKKSPMAFRCYFTRLLQSAWGRIQILDVHIEGVKIPEDIQNPFLSPAPILTEFNVHTPKNRGPFFPDTLLPNSTQALFANYAPLLIRIYTDQITFRTDSPWLSNLREIHIPMCNEIPGVLDLLSRTPLLEVLSLTPGQAIDRRDPVAARPLRKRIILPRLTEMCLKGTLASCTTVIDYVSPAKNCSLLFRSYDSDPIPNQVQTTLKERLPIYIVNHFTVHSPIEFVLRIHGSKLLHVSTHVTADDGDIYFHNEFQLVPESALETLGSVIQAFISARDMSSPLFNTVKKLTIDAWDVLIPIISDLYAMLLPFQSVERIITNGDGIRCIMKLALRNFQYGDHLVHFPKMHTLQMTYLIDDPEVENGNQALLQFLEQRRNTGHAVTKLDLTMCTPSLRDISDLERVHGLKVVWTSSDNNTVSYICGSGEPERLRFSLPPTPRQSF